MVDYDFVIQAPFNAVRLRCMENKVNWGIEKKVEGGGVTPPAKVITFADPGPTSWGPTWAVSAVHSLIYLPYLPKVEPPRVLQHYKVTKFKVWLVIRGF